MSGPTIKTIAAGETFQLSAPANYFYCYAATEELTFTIETGAGEKTFPLDRGTGWQAPFHKVTVTNATAAAHTVTIITFYVPELPVRGYFDNRELAAQVALNGNIQVVNSPYTDEGGRVKNWASSGYGSSIDATLAQQTVEIIAPATNQSGVRIRSVNIWITTPSAGAICMLRSKIGTANYYALVESGTFNNFEEFELPVGKGLELIVNTGMVALVYVTYDIL